MDNNRGAGLVLSLMSLAVLGLLAAVVFRIAQTLVRESVYQLRAAQAQVVAEAGLEDALYRLSQNYAWRTGFRRKSFAEGSYTVALSTDAPPWVTATGTSKPIFLLGPVARTVRARARFVWSSSEGFAVKADSILLGAFSRIDAYDSGLGTGGGGSGPLGADLWANRRLAMEPDAEVWGKATCRCRAEGPESAVREGVFLSTETRRLPDAVFPSLHDNARIPPGAGEDGEAYEAYDFAAGSLRAAEPSQAAHLPPGVYLFRGADVSSGSLTAQTGDGPVVVYLDGDLFVGPAGRLINDSEIPLMLQLHAGAGRTITLDSETPVHADIRAPRGRVVVGARQVLYGRIEAGEAVIRGTVRFDRQLGLGEPARVEWEPGTWSADTRRR